jgi:hypothetical protein
MLRPLRSMHRWREGLSLLLDDRNAYIPVIETTPEPSKVADVISPRKGDYNERSTLFQHLAQVPPDGY